MSNKNRGNGGHDKNLGGYLGRSACGKIAYLSRKAARKGSSRVANGRDGDNVRAYLCECGFWHLGHLPRSVRRGDISADEAYGR